MASIPKLLYLDLQNVGYRLEIIKYQLMNIYVNTVDKLCPVRMPLKGIWKHYTLVSVKHYVICGIKTIRLDCHQMHMETLLPALELLKIMSTLPTLKSTYSTHCCCHLYIPKILEEKQEPFLRV